MVFICKNLRTFWRFRADKYSENDANKIEIRQFYLIIFEYFIHTGQMLLQMIYVI